MKTSYSPADDVNETLGLLVNCYVKAYKILVQRGSMQSNR